MEIRKTWGGGLWMGLGIDWGEERGGSMGGGMSLSECC